VSFVFSSNITGGLRKKEERFAIRCRYVLFKPLGTMLSSLHFKNWVSKEINEETNKSQWPLSRGFTTR